MKQYTPIIVIVGLVLAIIAGMVWYSSTPGQYDNLAKCLEEKGVTFYGAFWCPHCQEQKSVFGRSARLLPYFECSTPDGSNQVTECKEKEIESYPTWMFADGSKRSEVLTPLELSEAVNCPLN